MAVSRRRFMASALSGAALAAVSGSELISAFTNAASAASPVGDVVGKITVGYQGWFACIGDGSPINAWWHWSNNWSQPPSPSNNGTLRAWPDMSDYTARYTTAYANNGNGAPPTLFSHYDQSTVNAHFASMQANNIDTAALQRFNPTGGEGPVRNAVTARVRTAAETYGRKFYIMYDVTGWTTMQSDIKADWTNLMSTYTSSTAYAKQNGKPVVGIWGHLPRRHPVVPGSGLLRHGWRTQGVADRCRWLTLRLSGHVPRVQHDLTVDGRRDRDAGRLGRRLQPVHRAGPGRLRCARHRLSAVRAAR
jgi:hypothetical protein